MKALLLALAALAAAAPANWLKTYNLSPYRQIWSTRIVVKDVQKQVPLLVAAAEKEGGKLVVPLSNLAGGPTAQQLSFSISKKGAARAAKAFKKLGKAEQPRVNVFPEAVPLDEVRAKRLALEFEQASHASVLAGMPSINEATAELIERLKQVEASASRPESEVLWNVNVEAAAR